MNKLDRPHVRGTIVFTVVAVCYAVVLQESEKCPGRMHPAFMPPAARHVHPDEPVEHPVENPVASLTSSVLVTPSIRLTGRLREVPL